MGHGQYPGEIDGLGVGHDWRDRVVRWTSFDQGFVTEHCVDQRFSPVTVEPVPCPDFGDVGGLGEGICGGCAALAASKAVVAALGCDDFG
jgi:hypothetical protein